MPWKTPSSQPTSWAWAIRSSASDGVSPSLNGRVIRSSSSRSSGARPCSSSRIDAAWMSRSRLRLASSSGAARTSSSSCLIMVPIRMTLAGCSTISLTLERGVGVVVLRRQRHRSDRPAVGPHDDDLLWTLAAVPGCSHAPILPRSARRVNAREERPERRRDGLDN